MAGPAPHYQPTFTADEVAVCERTIRRPHAPQNRVARAKLAQLLEDAGFSLGTRELGGAEVARREIEGGETDCPIATGPRFTAGARDGA